MESKFPTESLVQSSKVYLCKDTHTHTVTNTLPLTQWQATGSEQSMKWSLRHRPHQEFTCFSDSVFTAFVCIGVCDTLPVPPQFPPLIVRHLFNLTSHANHPANMALGHTHIHGRTHKQMSQGWRREWDTAQLLCVSTHCACARACETEAVPSGWCRAGLQSHCAGCLPSEGIH